MSDNSSSMNSSQMLGGATDVNTPYDEIEYPTNVDKRVEAKRNLKELKMYAFRQEYDLAWNRILASIEALSNKIGGEIPITEQLDGFELVLHRMADSFMENMYKKIGMEFALVGYYTDAMSRSKKDKFIGELKILQGVSANL